MTTYKLDDDLIERFSHKARKANNRARKAEAPGMITDRELAEIFIKQDGLCVYCEYKLYYDDMTIEHKLSMSRGGSNDASNIALSCTKCNNDRANEDNIIARTESDSVAETKEELKAKLEKYEEDIKRLEGRKYTSFILQKLYKKVSILVQRLNTIGEYV